MNGIFDASWARIGDGDACRRGDEQACRRLLWTYYLWPKLEEILRKVLAEPRMVVLPPRPDPPLIKRDAHLLAPLAELAFAQFEAGPQPEPPTLPARIELAKGLRDAFEQGIRLMEAEIEELGKR
jgi:hypothetical protein